MAQIGVSIIEKSMTNFSMNGSPPKKSAPHSSRTLLRGGNPNPAEFQKLQPSKSKTFPLAHFALLLFVHICIGIACLAFSFGETVYHTGVRSTREARWIFSRIFDKVSSSGVIKRHQVRKIKTAFNFSDQGEPEVCFFCKKTTEAGS